MPAINISYNVRFISLYFRWQKKVLSIYFSRLCFYVWMIVLIDVKGGLWKNADRVHEKN